jgi:hypothetical protein
MVEMADFPLSLDQAKDLNSWGQFIVPSGKHDGKTFEQVVKSGASSWYVSRTCTSFWARSLCEYVKAVRKGDSLKELAKSDDEKGKGEDGDSWLKVDDVSEPVIKKEDGESDCQTVTVKVPHGSSISSVTVNFK